MVECYQGVWLERIWPQDWRVVPGGDELVEGYGRAPADFTLCPDAIDSALHQVARQRDRWRRIAPTYPTPDDLS